MARLGAKNEPHSSAGQMHRLWSLRNLVAEEMKGGEDDTMPPHVGDLGLPVPGRSQGLHEVRKVTIGDGNGQRTKTGLDQDSNVGLDPS